MYHGIIVWCEPLELDGIFITWCFFHVLKYKEKSMSVISANNTFLQIGTPQREFAWNGYATMMRMCDFK